MNAILTTVVYDRIRSRGDADFADKLLFALCDEFGGHEENAAVPEGGAG